jgi:hypothetical protein
MILNIRLAIDAEITSRGACAGKLNLRFSSSELVAFNAKARDLKMLSKNLKCNICGANDPDPVFSK